MKRFYPSTEKVLLGAVANDDLFEYLFHGFALVNLQGQAKYVSYALDKPLIAIAQTQDVNEIFREKEEQNSNISGLIKVFAKLKHIQWHYGDSDESWNMIRAELVKEEYSETLDSFQTTITSLITRMFPGFKG